MYLMYLSLNVPFAMLLTYYTCIYTTAVPTSPPSITSVTSLSNTSFTVNWTISDPNYSYTVIWTNLITGVMNSFTVPENINSYTVTGLSDDTNYNVSVAAVNMCGDKTSDPITVYGKSVHVQYICRCS